MHHRCPNRKASSQLAGGGQGAGHDRTVRAVPGHSHCTSRQSPRAADLLPSLLIFARPRTVSRAVGDSKWISSWVNLTKWWFQLVVLESLGRRACERVQRVARMDQEREPLVPECLVCSPRGRLGSLGGTRTAGKRAGKAGRDGGDCRREGRRGAGQTGTLYRHVQPHGSASGALCSPGSVRAGQVLGTCPAGGCPRDRGVEKRLAKPGRRSWISLQDIWDYCGACPNRSEEISLQARFCDITQPICGSAALQGGGGFAEGSRWDLTALFRVPVPWRESPIALRGSQGPLMR